MIAAQSGFKHKEDVSAFVGESESQSCMPIAYGAFDSPGGILNVVFPAKGIASDSKRSEPATLRNRAGRAAAKWHVDENNSQDSAF